MQTDLMRQIAAVGIDAILQALKYLLYFSIKFFFLNSDVLKIGRITKGRKTQALSRSVLQNVRLTF